MRPVVPLDEIAPMKRPEPRGQPWALAQQADCRFVDGGALRWDMLKSLARPEEAREVLRVRLELLVFELRLEGICAGTLAALWEQLTRCAATVN